jgi:hypothetical protein
MHADRKSLRNFLLGLCSLLWLTPASAYAQIAEQRDCSEIVKNNMAKTKEMKPEVYATIKDYTFEWSKNRQSCVMIMQYKVHQTGKPPEVQVIAVNAVTVQPMEGYKNVFLIPASNLNEIMDAVNFLVEKYSH